MRPQEAAEQLRQAKLAVESSKTEARAMLTEAGKKYHQARAAWRSARANLAAAAVETTGIISEKEAGRLAGVSSAVIGWARRP